MLRKFAPNGKGRYSKAAMAKMARRQEASENGIQIEYSKTCKPGEHKEFIEDFSQIRSSLGTFEGWFFRFRCLKCNHARSDSRYFPEVQRFG